MNSMDTLPCPGQPCGLAPKPNAPMRMCESCKRFVYGIDATDAEQIRPAVRVVDGRRVCGNRRGPEMRIGAPPGALVCVGRPAKPDNSKGARR